MKNKENAEQSLQPDKTFVTARARSLTLTIARAAPSPSGTVFQVKRMLGRRFAQLV